MTKRILDCTWSDFKKMTAAELKLSIRLAEGRTLLAQSFNDRFFGSLVDNASNPELEAAFGADILLLNGYSLDEKSPLYGIPRNTFRFDHSEVMLVKDLKELVHRPIGIYLDCVPENRNNPNPMFKIMILGRSATEENFHRCVEQGVDFIVLCAGPGSNAKLDDIVTAT